MSYHQFSCLSLRLQHLMAIDSGHNARILAFAHGLEHGGEYEIGNVGMVPKMLPLLNGLIEIVVSVTLGRRKCPRKHGEDGVVILFLIFAVNLKLKESSWNLLNGADEGNVLLQHGTIVVH